MQWYVVLPVQLLVVLVWFHHHTGVDSALGGWLPTPGGLRAMVQRVHDGASEINRYAAPVRVEHVDGPVYLVAAALLVMLSVDLIACGLRRPPWAGLPVIIALTIPISVLDGGLSVPVFLGTGVLFVLLLAAAETDKLVSWGTAVTGSHGRGADILDRTSVIGPGLRIGSLTAVVALLLPALVPISSGVFHHGHHHHNGSGSGGGTITLTDPTADLTRHLLDQDHQPLLQAVTTADPTYVRLAVLDDFNGSSWQAASRTISSTKEANGPVTEPVEIDPTTPGTTADWTMDTDPDFNTSWLPVPYPTTYIAIDKGDWRYSPSTLDIASADKNPPTGIHYSLTAFDQTINPALLEGTQPASATLLRAMTKVPDLDPTVKRIAKQVTATGKTDYDKAVLLQDWFRTKGGFSYSLTERPGAGMQGLVHFLTDDKFGYCQQFSAAMAVMARSLGIPARVVVGFLDPSKSTADGAATRYQYTSDDLHAWPEIYFTGTGWVRFEPTPGTRTGPAPAWSVGVQKSLPITTPSPKPSKAVTPIAPVKKRGIQNQAPAQHSHSSTEPALALLVLVLLIALLVPSLVRRGRRRRRLAAADDPRAEAAGLWAELRATVIDLGIAWPEGRTVRTIAEALIRRVGTEERWALDRFVDLVERSRYSGTFEPDAEELLAARDALAVWCGLLAESVPASQVRRARWLPRSLLMPDRVPAEAPAARQTSGIG
jgi:transglutaminase-like putative cysteine protease